MTYIILIFNNSNNLEREVNKKLEQGWKLHGSLQVVTQMMCANFIQAMIKD